MQEDSIADVTPRSYDANIDKTYEIVENLSIRGRDQLFRAIAFHIRSKPGTLRKKTRCNYV